MYTGPPLQNRLWDVLVQQRAYPVVTSGDIKKAFLQVRIHESERDVLRFHWRPDENSEIDTFLNSEIEIDTSVYQSIGRARAFSISAWGVHDCHLDACSEKYPDETDRLRRSLYIDDILTGSQDEKQAHQRKSIAIEIMEDAKFELHNGTLIFLI